MRKISFYCRVSRSVVSLFRAVMKNNTHGVFISYEQSHQVAQACSTPCNPLTPLQYSLAQFLPPGSGRVYLQGCPSSTSITKCCGPSHCFQLASCSVSSDWSLLFGILCTSQFPSMYGYPRRVKRDCYHLTEVEYCSPLFAHQLSPNCW